MEVTRPGTSDAPGPSRYEVSGLSAVTSPILEETTKEDASATFRSEGTRTSATDLLRVPPSQSKKRKSEQKSITDYLKTSRPCNPDHEERITKKIVNMIAMDLLPISFVEGKGFLELLAFLEPNYSVISRRTVLRRLQLLYSEVKQKVKDKLQQADSVALTTDLWTSRATDSFITVTCHALYKDFSTEDFVLQTTELEVRHTAENIANIIKLCMEE